jgi:multidrug efflux pump subunit AcrB
MSHARSDSDIIRDTHNTARFFVEHRQISWVLLLMTCVAGLYAYQQMPKLKDPRFRVLYAAAVCPWPGTPAVRIEQLITRQMEERIAENPRVSRIESTTRSNVTIIVVKLDERTADPAKEFDDIAERLATIRDLPEGAGPIDFLKDFGETAALLLTVASPRVDEVELSLRARAVRAEIERVRANDDSDRRVSLIAAFPHSIGGGTPGRQRDVMMNLAQEAGLGRDFRRLDGPGFVGFDLETASHDSTLADVVSRLVTERLAGPQLHPDVWPIAVIRKVEETATRLTEVAGDKYSYRELDEFTDTIKRTLQNVPQVAKITRAGILPDQIYLEFSQQRLASLSIPPAALSQILAARNTALPGGMIAIAGRGLLIDPAAEFTTEREIGDVVVGGSTEGRPIYLRDTVDIVRGYQAPAQYLNYYLSRQDNGAWRRARSVTLSLQMRSGEQIAAFGAGVNAALASLGTAIPSDLVIARPSDQALQVDENVSLFMRSLYEAIALVVLVALVGFWEWRSAAVMALAIPLTLALTFAFMHLLRIDLQQVSIASLIISLGLLVDDPVVAGDAIKRGLNAGQPRLVAAWLGPTRLATAILFATITNIVAYVPLLMLTGGIGDFIYSLPIVLGCSLVASRITSMTFIPLLGYYLLRPSKHAGGGETSGGVTGVYRRAVGALIERRWLTLGVAVVLLVIGAASVRGLKVQFFPKDLSYISYLDIWLPEDATTAATDAVAVEAEAIVREVAEAYGQNRPEHERTAPVLRSVTSFIGGGGPRFWFSIAPELVQPNYGQLIINVADKHDTAALVPLWQHALSARIRGARVDVRQLETGKAVGVPVAVRVSGEQIETLRAVATRVADILRRVPVADRVRDDWGSESFKVKLGVNADRAALAGISYRDIALSTATALNGLPVTTLREADQRIPVVARLRVEERALLTDIQDLYIASQHTNARVPLRQIADVGYELSTEKIRRRNQFRTVTVSAFPVPGALPSEVLRSAMPALDDLSRTLPPGYRLEIGGEREEQLKGFGELAVVMLVSVLLIYLALVFQFRNAVKPWIVFAAIPFGVMGALVSLVAMRTPFGFMAFLGVASLIGVIVSHVIVLFDYIEEAREMGTPLKDALIHAGIARMRPVIVTVGATVFGLVPLALHGGPLWEGLCYSQIGGLSIATLVTLALVPVLYAIFVLDLKLIRWDPPAGAA